jgi:hypothetical protein
VYICCIHVYILFSDLMSLFKESYTPAPFPVLLEMMFDVREWLQPVNPQLHNISNPHIFCLIKNAAGSAVLRYKQWSREKEWLPSGDLNKCIEIIKQVCILSFSKIKPGMLTSNFKLCGDNRQKIVKWPDLCTTQAPH